MAKLENFFDRITDFIRGETEKTKQIVRQQNEATKQYVHEQLEQIKDTIAGLSKDTGMVDADKEKKGHADYELVQMLSLGNHGMVNLVRKKSTDEHFVMKELFCKGDKVDLDTVREAYMISEANHDNIVKLVEVYILPGSVSLVMEYYPHTLKDKIGRNEFNDADVKAWLKQILEALRYIHSHGIVHRDIKPENLLIGEDNVLRVGDFGTSRGFLDNDVTPERGTLYYRPPEDLVEVPYDKSFDVWGVGCVFYEMVEGKALFGPAASGNDVLHNIYRILGTPTNKSWLELTSTVPSFAENYPAQFPLTSKLDDTGHHLLMRLLDMEPDTRITADQALSHPYFAVN